MAGRQDGTLSRTSSELARLPSLHFLEGLLDDVDVNVPRSWEGGAEPPLFLPLDALDLVDSRPEGGAGLVREGSGGPWLGSGAGGPVVRYYEPPSPRHLPMPSHAAPSSALARAATSPEPGRLTFVPHRGRPAPGPSRFRLSAPLLPGFAEPASGPSDACAGAPDEHAAFGAKPMRKVHSFSGVKRDRDEVLILASPPSIPRDLGGMGAELAPAQTSPSKAKRGGKGGGMFLEGLFGDAVCVAAHDLQR